LYQRGKSILIQFKNFEDFAKTLEKKAAYLEKEVQELEFVINFCEENINKMTDNLEEHELAEVQTMKEMAQIFLDLQYDVINEKYKVYCETVKNLIADFFAKNEETVDTDCEFTDLLRFALDKIQTLIRYITVSTRVINAGMGKKETNRIDITNAYNEKIEKAKVGFCLI
jgi:hypothetical protein